MLNKLIKSSVAAAMVCLSSSSLMAEGQVIQLVNNNAPVSVVGTYGELDAKIVELADSLLRSSKIPQSDMGNIAITSFVDLHNLEKTTSFGRTVAETMFNELFVRGFNVADFRGQNALNVNKSGEFYITRRLNKINHQIRNSYVLVGTYTEADGKVLINSRIMDNITGKVVASAKTYYETNNCKILGNCPKPPQPRIIRVVSANTAGINCN